MGIIFALVGIIGFLFHYSQQQRMSLMKFFSSEAIGVVEISLDRVIKSDLSPQNTDLAGMLDRYFQDSFGVEFSTQVTPWVGQRVGLVQFPEGKNILALSVKDRKAMKAFLQQFLAEGESFVEVEVEGGKVLTPEYSSTMGFGLHGDWMFWSDDEALLRQQFAAEDKMEDRPDFKRLRKDLPANALFQWYLDTDAYLQRLSERPDMVTQKPIIEALSESLPAMGIAGKVHKGQLTFYLKLLTHQGIFHEDYLELNSPEIIPELAGFVPSDSLFFMNGLDLYSKYQHTKTFLGQLDPQFSIIFEGLLRAQSRELFGESFDFEKQFLSKMHGQYSTLLDVDFTDASSPKLDFVFLTKFGGVDQEQALSDLQNAVHNAQGRFAPRIEIVELPDGTVREELVSTPLEEIPIRKVETDNGTYFTAQNPVSDKTLSYGVSNGYFIFSTRSEAMEKVYSILGGQDSSLAENEDFRSAVLFRYAPSESYGFVSLSKLDGLWTLVQDEENANFWVDLFSVMKQQYRSITFSRKVYPDEVFFTFTLFGR